VNRIRLSVRRLLSVAAAMVLGLIGVLVVASPASAHYTVINGVANCDTTKGQWVVTWTVASKAHYSSTWLKFLFVNAKSGTGTPPTTSPTSPFDTTSFATNTQKNLPGPFTGTQAVVNGSAKWAHIEVRTQWSDSYTDPVNKPSKGDVTLSGNCVKDQPSPTANFQSKCDGSVLVTLRNDGGKAPALFTVSGVPGTTTVAANATPAPIAIPAGTGHIAVSEASAGNLGAGYDFKTPESCAPVKLSSKMDCTTLTVQLDNPEGPAAPYKVVSGSTNLTGTLAVGESKTFPAFAATTGTTAVVTVGQQDAVTIPWNSQEACAPTSPPALAQTGSNLTPVVSVGGALLVAGAGMIALLFLLRRRRTTAG
jgi:hypothetical protein